MIVKCDKCQDEAAVRLNNKNVEVKLTSKKADGCTDYCENCFLELTEDIDYIRATNDSDLGYDVDDEW